MHKDLTLSLALGWVGSASALGWPIIIWVAFWPLITGAMGGQIIGSKLPIDIHLYDFLNGLIPALVLTIFRAVFKAARPSEYSGSTTKNIAVQVLAAFLGVVLTLAIAASFGSIPTSYLVSAPIGMLSTWGQISGLTIVIIAISELRSATKQLARKTHRLSFLKTNLEQRVVEQREALQLEVEVRMSEQVDFLRAQLSELKSAENQDDRAAILAASISNTIDDVVRPLSQELANSVGKDTRAEMRTLRQVEREISRLPFIQRMRLPVKPSAVFNAPFIAIFLLVFMVPTYGYLFGMASILQVGIPASVLSVALTWLGGRLSKRITAPLASVLFAVPLGSAVATLPFAALNHVLLSDQNSELLNFALFGAFLISTFVFYGSLFYQAAFQILDRVKLANLELRKLVAFLQNEFQVNRRTLAQVVHGKVQARLQAASIRLKQADRITDDLIVAIQDDLSATVLDTTDTSLDAQSVEVLLTEMADQWSGICELTFSFGGQVSHLVNQHSSLKAAVVEVVREAINNAVKHGEADEADIVIVANDPGSVAIEIRNQVYSIGQNQGSGSRGYGSQLLDQITDSWSIRFEDGDAIFEATISIGGTNL